MSFDNCNKGCGCGGGGGNEWIWIIIAIIIVVCLCGDNNFFGGLFGNNDCCGHDFDCDRC